MSTRLPWALLAALVLTQISYPLVTGGVRAALTVSTVLLGSLLSVSHALLSRGPRAALALAGTTTLGGFAVEAVGVATGFPFGAYDYSGQASRSQTPTTSVSGPSRSLRAAHTHDDASASPSAVREGLK